MRDLTPRMAFPRHQKENSGGRQQARLEARLRSAACDSALRSRLFVFLRAFHGAPSARPLTLGISGGVERRPLHAVVGGIDRCMNYTRHQ